jgi:hypothetical protein
MGGRGRGGPSYGRGGGGGIAASIQAQQRQKEEEEKSSNNEDGRNVSKHGGEDDTETPEVGSPIVATDALEAELAERFERLSEMFGSDSNDEAEDRPLGSLRLKLAEFFVACMKKSSPRTVSSIAKLGVPKKLTVLFLRYEWSSMLHGVVTRSIVSAFEGEPSGAPSRKAWIDADIIGWLTHAWNLNQDKVDESDFFYRAGYMGHLIQIGFTVQQFVTENLEEAVSEGMFSEAQLAALADFGEKHLRAAHEVESTPLGGAGGYGGTSEGEEAFEEATEVYDVDMGEVIEGMTTGDQNVAINQFAKYLINRSEEEEEVETVDLGDLSHFGGDGDEDEVVAVVPDADVDHDIPASVRNVTGAPTAAALSTSTPAGPADLDDTVSASDQPSIVDVEINSMDESDMASALQPPPGPTKVSVTAAADATATAAGVSTSRASTSVSPPLVPAEASDVASAASMSLMAANFGDSSDEDEGTYEEFVDAPGVAGGGSSDLPNRLSKLELKSGDDGGLADVAEVDSPISTRAARTRPAASTTATAAALSSTSGPSTGTAITTILEDDGGDDSSDGDGEGWVAFDPTQYPDSVAEEGVSGPKVKQRTSTG